MKKLTFTGKRFAGTALAALTVVAGMSAVAFAGEPGAVGDQGKMEKVADIKTATTISMKAIPVGSIDGENVNFTFKEFDGEMVKMEKSVASETADTEKVEFTLVNVLGEESQDKVEFAAMELMEAKVAQIMIDEETGETKYSFDEGVTWEILPEIPGGEFSEMKDISAAMEVVPAETIEK